MIASIRNDVMVMEPRLNKLPSMNQTMLGMMNRQLNQSMDLTGNAVYDMDTADLATVGRFLGRTLGTVGTKPVREAYQNEGFRLACSVRSVPFSSLPAGTAADRPKEAMV
jgi:hypothetical protein